MPSLNDLDHEAFLNALDRYYQYPPLCAGAEVSDWLENRGADPEFWHHTVIHWNWDVGTSELSWIASQPECDQATASWILFAGSAGHLWPSREDFDAMQREQFDLLTMVARNCRSRFYAGPHFGFTAEKARDLAQRVVEFRRAAQRIGDPALWHVPVAAYGPFRGRIAQPAIDAVFDENGVLRLPMQTWFDRYG